MPINSESTYKAWQRYAWCRDNGHTKFIEKADLCERNFAGDQWLAADRAVLEAVRRPVLTINKIISTMSNLMGEQIYNRAEINYQPRSGAPAASAEILTKVFKQISDNNQLDWKRSDLFADGIIRSRGFFDVRLGSDDHARGEVVITNINSKNVVLDPDAEEYDPDSWGEVFTTKWVTPDDIAVLYSKEDAELLRHKEGSSLPYGYDSIDNGRDRFGDQQAVMYGGGYDYSNVVRSVRLIERQYRMLDKQKFFMSPETGDQRPVPPSFDRNRIALFVERYGFTVVPKLVRRIRWYVMADNVQLHDDWSPYKHITLIPYFPHFRYGNTIGLVENLVGSQELLNKVSSQELHVINTTANSGYVVRAGALVNMTVSELEQKGAQTGVVIEVGGSGALSDQIEKITPNAVPTGLDRISYKAEEHIKTISGVPDSQMGMDRADVAAKAIQAKQKAGATNNVKPLDNLTRTDFILARNILDLVQEHYTEERLMTIVKNQVTGETESFSINQPNPMSPEEHEAQGLTSPYEAVLNDLTLGEYGVVVTSVPKRETLEDSQFDQAVAMKELGVAIPDAVLVDSSRLINKSDIKKQMGLDANTPEAQAAAALAARGQEAEVAKMEAEAATKGADAGLRQAKTGETIAKTQVIMQGEPDDGSAQAKMAEVQVKAGVAQHTSGLKEREMEQKMSLAEREHQLEREKLEAELQLKAQDLAQKRSDARVKAAQDAATAAQKPAAKSKI